MYSIVMVAAMTAAPEAPDFFKHKGGCYGCYGCYGGSCYGCFGGGCFGGCAGCFGGCAGCYGGGWCFCGFGKSASAGYAFVGSGGCYGAAAPYYASCCGYGIPAASGFYTPLAQFVPPAISYAADTGVTTTGAGTTGVYPAGGAVYPGYGFYPGYPAVGVTGAAVVPVPGTTGTTGGTGTRSGMGTGTGTGTSGGGTGSPAGTGTPGGAALGTPEAVPGLPASRAQVVVRLPADAKLYADGQATMLGGAERVYLTPEISTARDYTYKLKVEFATGEPETKQIVVRAGHRTVVEFAPPVVVSEKISSPVTVTLPEKAKLFVDGVAATTGGGTQTFRTPELTKGRAYVYEFRAEVDKDGKTEVLSRQVSFKAGESITVNFVEAEGTRTALK